LALNVGLGKLREIVAQDYKLSGWVNHPMPGFKKYQNKIWKWDFRPEGDRSGTRKGWRLYAYAADPKAPEPIPATAFLCNEKDDVHKGNHAKVVADALKKFLAETVEAEYSEECFRHQTNDDGKILSLCLRCFGTVALWVDLEELVRLESAHICP
jgi:hypothetical protein